VANEWACASVEGGGMAETKSLYELFVLGRLMAQPFYGYLLRKILDVAIGPARKISWGVLYPLIRRLEDEGLIATDVPAVTPTPANQETERQRRMYRITEAGCDRFYALMREPGDYNTDYADWFSIKLSCFAYVGAEQQLDILRHYRGYLQFVTRTLTTARQRVASIPAIGDRERPHYLRMLDHKLLLLATDLTWVEGEIAHVGAETQTADLVAAEERES